jgi:riboflavin biosynthesis pyrimidine reductase
MDRPTLLQTARMAAQLMRHPGVDFKRAGAADLIDELFLTLAPKIKLGDEIPTFAGGTPLPREKVQSYKLEEVHQIGDEIFLRYTH